MGRSIDVIKVITHADGGEGYVKNATKYPSNEDCVGLRGYGVDCNNPETAKMQFESVAKYHGNNDKNQFVQFMISFLKETASDAETAMAISDQAMEPLKDNHMILIGGHEKHREESDFHTHNFVGTTDLETGKMLHPTNKLNYAIAQNLADIIQKPVKLVIERKNKTPEQKMSQEGDNKKKNGNDDFTRIFYPHKTCSD